VVKRENLLKKIKVHRTIILILVFLSFQFYCGYLENKSPVNEGKPLTPQKFYSKQNPAEWLDYVADHVPSATISQSREKDNLTIYVVLKNPDEVHYIESLGILDEDDHVVDKITFGSGKRSGVTATFTLNATRDLSRYRAFARCSQHDLWITPLAEALKVP